MIYSMNCVIKYVEVRSNGRILRGMIHWNDSNAENIIIIHGYFSANKIGPNRLFFNIAKELSKNGYNVYRFDLSGMGESDGEIGEITFNDHENDIINIFQYVKRKSKQNIILIPHCMGVPLSFSTITKNKINPRLVIALAPFVSNSETMYNFWCNEQAVCKKKIPTTRKGLPVNESFFYDNTSEEKLINYCSNIKTRSICILAENDQFVSLETIIDILNLTNKEYIIITNADHNFTYNSNELIDKLKKIIKGDCFFG